MPRRQILTERQRSALFDLPTDEASLLRHYILSDDDLAHKDVQAARATHRRKVRQEIKEKRGRVADLLPAPPAQVSTLSKPKPETPLPARLRLRIYAEDR